MTTLFTKIISGEIPGYKIYENDLVFVFLDIFPLENGHLLIVPKIEIDKIYDLPDQYYQEIFKVAKSLSPILEKVFKSDRVMIMAEGLEVPHAHLHLIPLQNKPVSELIRPKIPLNNNSLEKIQKQILTELSNSL